MLKDINNILVIQFISEVDKSNHHKKDLLHKLGREEEDEDNEKCVDIDENVGNIIQRAQPFEGNQAIIMGLQKEYQEQYKYLQNYHICECSNLCCCFSNKTSTGIDEPNMNMQ